MFGSSNSNRRLLLVFDILNTTSTTVLMETTYRLLPCGIPHSTISTALMETRTIKDDERIRTGCEGMEWHPKTPPDA
jgi:hypothetical protein